MAEINRINADFSSGFGLAADNMGINPADKIDPNKTFSRLLEKSVNEASKNREREAIFSIPDHAAGIIPRQTTIDRTDKLYEQCEALETFLVKNILNAMRKNVMKSSIIDTGYAGEIYEDMLWDEYAKEYTKNAGFGLADLAYLELTGQRGRKV